MGKKNRTLEYVNRRPSRVAAALAGEVWAILPEKLEAMVEVIELRMAGMRFSDDQIEARIGLEPRDPEPIVSVDGVAIVNVFGVLAKRMGLFAKISGGTSFEKLNAELTELADNGAIKSIVLNVDSPGGTIQGAIETSDLIFNLRRTKRVIGIANENANSAAYLVASAAREFVVTPTAMSGNIGTIIIHQEFSAREKEEGIKTNILKSGALKASGNPHLKMTDPERRHLQERVDGAFALFANAVARNRGMSVEAIEDTEARAFLGQDAVFAGLADSVMTLDELIERERNRHAA
jgi:signal peptide peptidase SppA